MTPCIRIAAGLTGLTVIAVAFDLFEIAGILTIAAGSFVAWELSK